MENVEVSLCFLADFPPLSLRFLKMHFLKRKIWFLLDWSFFFHQQVVFDRRDKITSDLPRLRSYTLRACSCRSLVTAWHLDKCVTVRSVNIGSMMSPYTICRPWTVSLRQTERQDGTTKCCAVFFWREDKQNSPGSSPNQTNRWVNHGRRWLAPGQEELD